jgi:serine/threonine-protein kinase
LHEELSVVSAMRARFLREGRVANAIGHPGAVKVMDEDIAEDQSVFLVMELLDGESLEARAKRMGGVLPIDEVLAATDQILDVLVAAHKAGVVHRDLKPDNVFLTREGQVKVLDFGIARLRELSTATSATHTGAAMGTPAFMPPEQARGLWDEVDGRSDLWAVGALMFSLMTGRRVHTGRTTNEVLLAAMTEPAAPIRSIESDVPETVANVVDRALAYERDDRWQDAQTMQDAIRHAYHEFRRVPLSEAPKLLVPPSVADRTQPGVAANTGDSAPAMRVVSDVTAEPVAGGMRTPALTAATPRRARQAATWVSLIALASLLAVGTGGLLLWGKKANPNSLESVSATSVAAPNTIATISPELDPEPSATAEIPTVEPSALPSARPAATPTPAGTKKAKTGATVSPSAGKPKDWKDQRR